MLKKVRSIAILLTTLLLSGLAQAADTDGDGFDDSVDNCISVSNPGQCDANQDGYGNACDVDFNRDGKFNAADSQLFTADYDAGVDSGIGSDLDCDGGVSPGDLSTFLGLVEVLLGDFYAPGPSGHYCAGTIPCIDGDSDGLLDQLDNCPLAFNPVQCDGNEDGYGNACDGDLNGNGGVDLADFTWFLAELNQLATGSGSDIDCDGGVSLADLSHFRDHLLYTAPGPSGLSCAGSQPCLDNDHDGAPDSTDNCLGLQNTTQADADADGVGDACEGISVSEQIVLSDYIHSVFASADDFHAVIDSQGRIHGFYVADVPDGTGGMDLSRALTYFGQSIPDGPFSSQIVATAAPGFVINSKRWAVELNRADEPCVWWMLSSSAQGNLGCMTSSGFVAEVVPDASGVNFSTTQGFELAFDIQNRAHITFRRHFNAVLGERNHSTDHAWTDGANWYRELVEVPTEFQPPVDVSSTVACVAVDGANQVHVISEVHEDDCGTTTCAGNPLDYDLAHSVKDQATNQWTSTVIKTDLGTPEPWVEQIQGCKLKALSNGDLHVVYKNLNDLYYSKNVGAGWVDEFIGQGSLPSNLQVNASQDIFVVAPNQNIAQMIRRIASGPQAGTYSTTVAGQHLEFGDSILIHPSSASGGSECTVLQARAVIEGSSIADLVDVVAITIDDCEQAFDAMPVPDGPIPVPVAQ